MIVSVDLSDRVTLLVAIVHSLAQDVDSVLIGLACDATHGVAIVQGRSEVRIVVVIACFRQLLLLFLQLLGVLLLYAILRCALLLLELE